MPRVRPVVVTALAIAAFSVSVAGQEEKAKGKKHVLVHAVCPNSEGGPLQITVNPWTAFLDQGDDTVWKLQTNRPQDNTIKIEAKAESDWPYPDRELSGETEVTFERMKGNAKGDDYLYNITLYCGTDKVVIDPRVRVGP